jgi:hypothetical protein
VVEYWGQSDLGPQIYATLLPHWNGAKSFGRMGREIDIIRKQLRQSSVLRSWISTEPKKYHSGKNPVILHKKPKEKSFAGENRMQPKKSSIVNEIMNEVRGRGRDALPELEEMKPLRLGEGRESFFSIVMNKSSASASHVGRSSTKGGLHGVKGKKTGKGKAEPNEGDKIKESLTDDKTKTVSGTSKVKEKSRSKISFDRHSSDASKSGKSSPSDGKHTLGKQRTK